MSDIIKKIKEDAQKRLVENRMDKRENLMYLDHRIFEKGEELDIVQEKISFEQSTYVVFVDESPGMNWAHPCHYLLYDAKNGKLLKQVDAEFPFFLQQGRPKTLELFHTSRTVNGFFRKKKIKIPFEPENLSAWRQFTKFPIPFTIKGHRYAILYSGLSNCRHVNDMEFLYRTLVDIYGYDPNDIYVLNFDGTLNWNAEAWEPSAPSNYPVDGTPFRLQLYDTGNRSGFQNAITDLANRIKSDDSLFIHTNNHGGWSSYRNEGYMASWGGSYYANDFANDLAQLPKFWTLLVMMEPCHAGAFNNPIISKSPADRTVVQAAVPWDEGSAGGWFFDPWAEMWISAMAGVRGDGSALTVSPDDNLDTLISAWESFDFAIHIDNPVMDESSPDLSKNVFLSKYQKTSIGMKACNNRYVCAEDGGNKPLIANRDWIKSWETFKLVDLGNGKVALQGCNGKYVCAEDGGNKSLIANRDWIKGWETFEYKDLGNNKFALKACNGKYVCAENGGNKPLIANRDWIKGWETFTLILK